MFLLILLSLWSFASPSLINRVGNNCDPPPVPQFLPDSKYGSYCRFNASYSQLDIGFIIGLTHDMPQSEIESLRVFLITEFKLFYGNYGNDANDITIVAAARTPTVTVPFGQIQSGDDLTNEFNNFPQWYTTLNNGVPNITAALDKMNTLFDYRNYRGKLLVILADINQFESDLSIATAMKDGHSVRIFVVGYAQNRQSGSGTSYLKNLCTPGWYSSVFFDNPMGSDIFNNYSNFARQASCKCSPNTTQFFAQIPSANPEINGPVVNEYYADCLENDRRNYLVHNWSDAKLSKAVDSFDNPKLCQSEDYINADTRPIQVATPCSEVLGYLSSDILIVADTSKLISVKQLDALSQNLLKTLGSLNFNTNQHHSSRLSLITFATLAKVQFDFNKIKNASDLPNLLNLSKYRNIFDGQRNANLAFLLAKTALFSNPSYRKPTIVFISSGFSNSQDPSQIVSLIKTLYNADVITISTTPDSNNVDKLATEGLALNLGPELPDTFKFAVTQSSCYCPANTIQFVHKNPINQAVTRYAECFFGTPTPKTPDDAFSFCAKFNSTPVVVTSQAKAQFLIESVIPNEINQSPMFSLGLKRHMSYNSVLMWHEYLQDGYTYATYPPKLSTFHDLNQNCTAAVVTGEKDIGIVAMNCKNFKLPVICQKKATDASS